jgi:hypothetical protein
MSMPRDIAGDYLQKIQQELLTEFQDNHENFAEGIEENTSPYKQLFQKVRYHWKPEDQHSIGQLRAVAEKVIEECFSKTFSIIDELYDSFRKIKTNQYGIALTDHTGRHLYEKDEHGNPIEDFSLLDGLDIEKALLDLQREKLVTSQQIAELLLEANFAHFSYKDDYWEKYESLLDGTNPLREAKANRETKEAKYFSYFRYYIWYRANEFGKELDNLMRILDRIRGWRVYAQK